ncbi:MAG: hypothetical protein J6Y02_13505 [Pseudobutyrivibrio sp.]|nr:hypothetical protein [Pseudobutyrivibrio sp.]
MSDSILNSIKKKLGYDAEYTSFDPDIIMAINAVFNVVTQLGVGPKEGFSISDASATWDDFMTGMTNFNMVKELIFMKVKIIFDPPQSSHAMNAFTEMIKEYECRLNYQADPGVNI